jgi:hypothetical protein
MDEYSVREGKPAQKYGPKQRGVKFLTVLGRFSVCLVGCPYWKKLLSKGLQLRLELGNVVTGEGERGESGSWRLAG